MKWSVFTLWMFVLLCAASTCPAQRDGGGRDVSVALFSAQPARKVVVMAAAPGAWWSPCTTCEHHPLIGTLRMPDVREIVAGGKVTVREEEHEQARTANGRWHLRVGNNGNVDVVLTLPSERYVAAVLMGETNAGEPRESLRAMAVVARTFVLRSSAKEGNGGRVASDVCDSTACQAMKLGPVSSAVNEAVQSSAGETLWYGGERAQVFFSGSCGGTTESATAVWPKLTNVPYLKSIHDSYCVRKDRAAWHAEISLASVREVALREGWHLPPQVVSAQVKERTSSERARVILFSGSDGARSAVSASALRLAAGRSLGWNLIRSDAYELHVRGGLLVFDGKGHGHGVGLCQQGATEMARLGKSYREILAFYFPGTTVRVTRLDEGWMRSSLGGLTLMSTAAPAPGLTEEARAAWNLAKSRFPLQQAVLPVVTLEPTTELFRQMTLQPGWQLASTSGNAVFLQPATVMAANRVSMAMILRHEMLHVAVESNASAKAPLWLREGLVEVLSGAQPDGVPSLSAEETEQLLRSAASRQQSQTAHAAAGARTLRLVERYGMSVVRGWLIAGSTVPTD